MQQHQQISLSPLKLQGDEDKMEENTHSGQSTSKGAHSHPSQSITQLPSFNSEIKLIKSPCRAHSTDFTDLLYKFNHYLKRKFEKTEFQNY